jgi:hypothetical protein
MAGDDVTQPPFPALVSRTICKAILGSGVPVTKVEILVRVIEGPYPNFWLYT